MAYSNFTLDQVTRDFELEIDETIHLFPDIEAIEISDFLTEALDEYIPLALAVHTEKVRSELIVAPILVEFRKLMDRQISLFSGVEFNVDPDKGLNGRCDFIISRSKEQLFLRAPIILMVEAKGDNIKDGLGQCVAEMVAARLFNEREGNGIHPLYGIVTTGSIWQLLKLEGQTVFIDLQEYYASDVGKILSILVHMVR